MADYYIYNVSKRKNSTLVPTNGLKAELVLKSGTSLLDPVLLLHDSHKPVISEVWFEGRYYFVNDIVSVRNDLWELHCKVDVLATYKANILATPSFVLYDSAANTELTDSRLSINTAQTVAESAASTGIFDGFSVLVGIVGKHGTGIYVMRMQDAKVLLSTINNWLDNTFDEETELVPLLIKAVKQLIATGKAPDCIKSAMLFPVDTLHWRGTTTEVSLGDYDTGLYGKLLERGSVPSQNVYETMTLNIPWQFTDWRRNSPYTELYLELPFAGLVKIPTAPITSATSITVEINVCANGTITYIAHSNTGVALGRWTSTCADSYMIGSSNINPLSSAISIGSAGAGAAGLGVAIAASSPMGAIAAGSAVLMGIKNNMESVQTCIGGSGGTVPGRLQVRLFSICHNTNVEPSSVSAVMGTPTMATKTPAAGYVETKCFSVSGTMTDRERSEINSLMDGGVYIE